MSETWSFPFKSKALNVRSQTYRAIRFGTLFYSRNIMAA